MKIRIKLLHDAAVPPVKQHAGDVAYDVVATSVERIDDDILLYHTGLAFDLPPGVWIDVRPRSSIYKTGLILSNAPGTGDNAYKGEYKAIFYRVVRHLVAYEAGDRICQFRFVGVPIDEPIEFEVVEDVGTSTRGEGGYGSTGR